MPCLHNCLKFVTSRRSNRVSYRLAHQDILHLKRVMAKMSPVNLSAVNWLSIPARIEKVTSGAHSTSCFLCRM